MNYLGFIFIALLTTRFAFAADFGCTDARLSDPAVTFEQTIDLYGEAYESNNENCLVATTNKAVEKMDELNDGTPEHFQLYVAAMKYLGSTPKISKEAKLKIGTHLEIIFGDEGFLSYFIDQEDHIESESAFYSTATLFGLTGFGVTGEWFLRSAFSLALRNSPTRIARSAGLRGLRRVGAAFIRSPRIPRLQPRLLARGLGGTANQGLQESGKQKVILDLRYSPLHLAGFDDAKTSLNYFTFWQTFTQQAVKWTGAAAMGFGSGIAFGHIAQHYYAKWGITKGVQELAERIALLRNAMFVIRANKFTSHAADMTAAALEPVAFAASTVATILTLRGIELYIEKLKIDEVRSGLEELKSRVQAWHAPGTQHSDFNTILGVNLILDHVRLIEALMVAEEVQKQLDISNQYIATTAIDPICAEIKEKPVDVKKARANALVWINSSLSYANITAKPKYDRVQELYDENLKFIGELKGSDGNLEPYLESAMVRLANMKLTSAATLDTPSRIAILQQTATGLYDEMKARLVTHPEEVEKEFSCHKPADLINDPPTAILF